jgi:tetratricopeptide (TPR) repeat protein
MRTFCSVTMLLLVLSGAAMAQEAEPQSADEFVTRGIARYNGGNLDGALADFNRAITLDPAHAGAYGNRGYAREDRGDLEGALADYTKAISLDPNGPPAYVLRGSLRLKNGDMDGGLADFTKAISLDPTDASLFATRGVVRQLKGELDGAIEDFRKAIALDPNNAVAYKSLAFILATASRKELRNGKQAVAYARKACELEKWGDPFTLEILALAYAETGDFRQAAEWQEKALESADYSSRAGDKGRQRLESFRQNQKGK